MPDGLVATSQNSPTPRVLLQLDWAGAEQATIYRVHSDSTEAPVRNAEPASLLGAWAGHDHEAPLDQYVTYKATSPKVTIATDAFDRTVGAGGWGTPTFGPAYTVIGTASDFSVGSGVGAIAPSATNADRIAALDVGAPDQDITVLLDTNTTPTGATIRYGLVGRLTDANNHYRAVAAIATTGVVTAEIATRVGGTLTVLGTAVTTLSIATNIMIRFRCVGALLQLKLWQETDAEPSTWTLEITEPVVSLASGNQAGCFARRETGNTAPTSLAFDTFAAYSLAAAPLVSAPVITRSFGRIWLKHLAKPILNRAVTARDRGPRRLPARRGALWPLNRADPIIVHQIRGLGAGSITLRAETADELAELLSMLEDGSVLLLQYPDTISGDSLYASVSDVEVVPPDPTLGDLDLLWISVPYDIVGRPEGSAGGGAGVTYDDLDAVFTDFAAQTASGRTYASLSTGP